MNKETHPIQYLEILKEAFKITWKNRYLWWFGLLASLTSIGSTSFNLNSNSGTNNANDQSTEKIYQFLHNNLEFIIIAVAIIFVIFIIFIVLGILGRGALIKAIAKTLKKNESTGFKSGLKESRKYFWRLLAINLAVLFSFLLVLIVLITPIIFLFANNNILAGIMIALMALIIMLPLFLLFVFLRMYSYLYVVLGELGFWPALENAYALLRNNLAASLVLLLLFIPLGLVLLFVLMMLIVPIVILFLVIGSLAFLLAKNVGVIVVVITGFLILLPIILLIRSVYETFAQTVWILFFQEIASPKVTEKVEEKVVEPKPTVEPDIASGI